MSKKVALRKVTVHNWEEVVDLELSDEQEDFVASNAYSLAESKFNRYAVPRAIYAGKRVVGFLMYESLADDDEPHEYSIYRFMIDIQYQGQGYGRRALALALKEITMNDPKCRRIQICYMPDNLVSKRFYQSFGFREIGLDDDGEMLAELRVQEKSF